MTAAEKIPDEAELQQAGKLDADPAADVKKVSVDVPRVLTVRDILSGSMARAFSTDRPEVCTTGHYRLDKITGGMRPGFVWVLGADTSWGKSSWVVALADENIKAKRKVLIVSSEDTEEIYGDRLMARRAKVSATNLRDGKLQAEEKQRVMEVVNAGESIPVYVDARRWPIEKLEQHILTIIREQKIDLVCWDYLQEFPSNRKHQDERVKYREIAARMRHITKSTKVAGLILSQLTISEPGKLPNRHNIRECRDVANAAEVIAIGFEPEKDIKDRNGTVVVAGGTKSMFIDKVKNGQRGSKVPLEWDSNSAAFVAVQDPEIKRLENVISNATGGDNFDDVGESFPEPEPPEHWTERY
jgi:replicative DNA helicase